MRCFDAPMSPYDVAELTYETPHRYFSRAVESARRLYGAVAIVSRAPRARAAARRRAPRRRRRADARGARPGGMHGRLRVGVRRVRGPTARTSRLLFAVGQPGAPSIVLSCT